MRFSSLRLSLVRPFGAVATGAVAGLLAASNAEAQLPLPLPRPPAPATGPNVSPEPTPAPQTLRGVRPPRPDNLADFIADEEAAIALGKALFWDMQVGSDGIVACATCHFSAGVDTRSKNQLHPGRFSSADNVFAFGGPNSKLTADDFPFHRLADPTNANSSVLRDRDEVTGSSGVTREEFVSVSEASVDEGTRVADPVFNVGAINTRRVVGRNTPTMINAVFNQRNLWDGRAQNEFNGVNPFGDRAPKATLLRLVPSSGQWYRQGGQGDLTEVRVRIKESSLASQATGAPLNNVLMSWNGRTWPAVGKKLLLSDEPLALQRVSPDDSVLGNYSSWPYQGLWQSYTELVQRAFKPEWWDARAIITVNADGTLSFRSVADPAAVKLANNEFTQMMHNFSLFFGLAVQLYETTLISDDSPFDRYVQGDAYALTEQEQRGLELFFGQAKCANCHGGPVFTNAAAANVAPQPLERMTMGDGQIATYDNGYYNIGVRPSAEDVGIGGKDPFGNPLSNTALAQLGKFDDPNIDVAPGDRIAVQGAFKVPSLRNVALTAPYFHNGGQLTLRQVVEFYNRGGDFANTGDKAPEIQPLKLSNWDIDALVAFLETLTDSRVEYQRAPFDHPELYIPAGHVGNTSRAAESEPGIAQDEFLLLYPAGATGGPVLPNFLEY